MAVITTRQGKGSPLTNAEMDANLNNLNSDKLEVSAFDSTADTWILTKSINSLSDVDIVTTTPLEGQTIIWDPNTQKFVPGDSFNQDDFNVAIAVTSIDALSDVDTTTDAPQVGHSLVWNGTNFIPSWPKIQEAQGTILLVQPTVIDSFSATDFRSCEYTITLSIDGAYHYVKITVMHDGINTSILQYGDVVMGPVSSLGEFDASINSGNVEVVCTPYNENTDIRYVKQLITINGDHLGFASVFDLMQGNSNLDLTYGTLTYDLN